MKRHALTSLGFAWSASLAVLLAGCTEAPSPSGAIAVAAASQGAEAAEVEVAPPAPPEGAIVFDLKYRPRTGGKDDLSYYSFWGYGGSAEEGSKDPFLRSITTPKTRLHYEQAPPFRGREWAAVEHNGRQALAMYFDVNANGRFDENERILPVRKDGNETEFITPDFMNPTPDGREILCRALLQVNFHDNSGISCMWSPAALVEGTASMGGKPARLLLYAGGPGGSFDEYGSSRYALRTGNSAVITPGDYISRETLSSVIACEGDFYRINIEGRRSNGLPMRAVLEKDTTPRGALAVALDGAEALTCCPDSLYLRGAEDKKVYFRVSGSKSNYTLPVGAYAMTGGMISYGAPPKSGEWTLSFSEGPRATITAGEIQQVSLSRPVLRVRAIEEQNRYSRTAAESETFKKGTKIYLEPRITGRQQETFSRFRQAGAARTQKVDRPPRITITSADGKEILSKTMEYG